MKHNPFDLTDKVAVVTGAGGGIGSAIAQTFAAAGARVVAADHETGKAEQCANSIRDDGGQAVSLAIDVTDQPGVDKAIEKVLSDFGRVDIMVNAAGIVTNTPAETMPPDEWLRVIDVNLNGVFWCCQAAARAMLQTGGGSIVNISSMNSLVANKPQPQVHYNASKSGVIMLTRSLAVEWAQRGIRVNAISPGYISTAMTKRGLDNSEWRQMWLDMTPMGRVGDPVEIANAAWYLASNAASFTTGSNLVADGGYTAW